MPKIHNFFSNTKIFVNQKTPDPKKNFFENYSDHLDFMIIHFQQKFNKLKNINDLDVALDYIGDEAIKRLKMFDPLRDGHDYFDEVVGATGLPALGIIASIASLGTAIWESAQALAIEMGIKRNDREDHLDIAAGYLILSAAAIIIAIASFVKSAISLITRPLVTALSGYAEQDEDRFHNEDALIGKSFR
ncbi:hypothetical protein Lmor_1765 [Legionella moravica]|uniref:Uncharacterized protein n=1 Tax=Legionella moravica TaxID=39962 RepID=A0A378K0A0_9GAMM|nr:hypothetical protein [Legionella moravica]KTD34368.1 hypothetical protein Lmor_1765 [Legionella moravica]STX64086.1 Uncharacterised protein [Legionella moravica]